KRSGRDSNPRTPRGVGCFQGSCIQPDSATAPSRCSGRGVTDRLPEWHCLIRLLTSRPENIEPVISVRLHEFEHVAARVRVDSPEVDLAGRAELALHPVK